VEGEVMLRMPVPLGESQVSLEPTGVQRLLEQVERTAAPEAEKEMDG